MGCGSAAPDSGFTLELTVQPACQDPTARIDSVRFNVQATPAVSSPIFERKASEVFATYPAS